MEAGWYYDPALDTPDSTTCAYCSLSLDAWDVGDDPMEEHRRRTPDCLFFALKELYHPAPKPATKKGKRTSTRTSTASTASKARSKKQASEQIDDTISSISEKPIRGKKGASIQIDTAIDDVFEKSTRSRKRMSEQTDTTIDITVDNVKLKPTRGKKRVSEQIDNTAHEIIEQPASVPKAKKAASKAKVSSARTSTASTTTKLRNNKRTSDQIGDTEVIEGTPKRIRYSSISSLPDSLPVGTPKRMPVEPSDPETANPESMGIEPTVPKTVEVEDDISSLPASILVGTPKKTPTRTMEFESDRRTRNWEPIDMEAFFSNTDSLHGFINDVVIDAGLDTIVTAGTNTEDLQAAVLSGLTKFESEMSVEQWVLYNAKRGEEKLRQVCEKQILAFDVQAIRARAAIESLPTY